MGQFQPPLYGLKYLGGQRPPVQEEENPFVSLGTGRRLGDVSIPDEGPNSLDTFRLGDVSTKQFGQNPSDALNGLRSSTEDLGDGVDMLPGEDTGVREQSYLKPDQPGQSSAFGNPDPLEALQALGGGPNRSADLVAGRGRQEDLLSEMQRNRYLADTSGGTMTSGATPPDINRLQSSLNADPNFGTAARAETEENRGALREANMAGFATPQEAAGRSQRMEQQKLDQPLELEKLKSMFGLDEVKAKADAAQKLQDTSGLPEFYKGQAARAEEAASQGRPIRSSTKSGTTFETERPINPALYGNLRQAQAQLDKARNEGTDTAPHEALVMKIQKDLDAQQAGAVPQAGGIDQDVESMVTDIIADPKKLLYPIERLVRGASMVQPPLTPQQLAQFEASIRWQRGF